MRIRERVTFILCLLYASSALAGCAAQSTSVEAAAMRAAVKADAAQMMSDIDEAQKRDPGIGLSSNPYDYVGISPAFDRLVARERPALGAIVSEIEDSPDNGLREYLLAIAGGSILNDTGHGDTGKAWAAWYRSQE